MTDNLLYTFDNLIAVSNSYKTVISKAKKYADTDATILLTGNTGTGKSFLAKVIHNTSKRRKAQFIHINCANLAPELLESTLFGHERGAFTGADRKKLGSFELANHGTIFLDEIGEISNHIQTKLLRVLEDKKFERLGGRSTISADVRIIVATNKSLLDLIQQGKFREDLYYRLSVLPLHIPNLSERKACISELSEKLLFDICKRYNKKLSFDPLVKRKLEVYSWPGNIRQLQNVIEKAVILCDDIEITDDYIDLPSVVINDIKTIIHTISKNNNVSHSNLEELEKQTILTTLEENYWNQKITARVLGLSPRALNYKISKYKIKHHTWRKNKS